MRRGSCALVLLRIVGICEQQVLVLCVVDGVDQPCTLQCGQPRFAHTLQPSPPAVWLLFCHTQSFQNHVLFSF